GRRGLHPGGGQRPPGAAADHRRRRPGGGQRDGRLAAPRAPGAQPAGVPRRVLSRAPGVRLLRNLGRDRVPGGGVRAPDLDMSTRVGSVTLPSPVLTASGTAGHGAELARYVDLSSIGAVVV